MVGATGHGGGQDQRCNEACGVAEVVGRDGHEPAEILRTKKGSELVD
jgi:hypothetical protein